MEYQRRKLTTFMGFKPITKYFTASKISKKPYKISKARPYGTSKERAFNILAFMGFKPMTSITKYFPAYELL